MKMRDIMNLLVESARSPATYRINVYDGSEDHWVRIRNAPTEDVAKERAIQLVEDKYGTSWWRVGKCVIE